MVNKHKKVKDGKLFTIYLDKPHLEHIKRAAHRMSMEEGRDISTCEAIRMSLELVFPMEKQIDMFPDLGKRRRLKRVPKGPVQMTLDDLLAEHHAKF